jgi:hypothetical protein
MALLCTILSFGQNLSDPGTMLPVPSPAASPLFLSADHAEWASIESDNEYKNIFARDGGADKCEKYHKMKTAGIIVASVGGGLFITGIALVAIGIHDDVNYINNGSGVYYGTNGGPLIGGGAVCIVFGIGGIGAGIPLAIIGSVKSHKYCGSGRSYMELSTKGNGLALNF